MFYVNGTTFSTFRFPFVLLFAICHHSHKPGAFCRVLEHFLVLKTDSSVVTLHNVTEVVDERLNSWVVFVIDVCDLLVTEWTLLTSWVGSSLWFLNHNKWGVD
jgi:hypothetical protein